MIGTLAKWIVPFILFVGCADPTDAHIAGTYSLEGPIETTEPYISDSTQLSQIWLSIPASPITDASRIKFYSAITFNYDNESVTIPWITGHQAGQQCGGEAMEPMALIIDEIDSSSFRAHATWDECHKCGLLCAVGYGESELTIKGRNVAGVINVYLEYDGWAQSLALFPTQNDTPSVIECSDNEYCGWP